MIEIPVVVPEGCRVTGTLYSSDNPQELSQDMLEVVLPNGVLVDVGSYRDGDVDRRYVVSVSYGMRLLAADSSKYAEQAAHILTTFVELWSAFRVPQSWRE